MSVHLATRERIGWLAAIGVLALAIVAAFLTGSTVGSINGGVESLAAASGPWLGQIGGAGPLGYAFCACMGSAGEPIGLFRPPCLLAALFQQRSPPGAPR